MRGLHHAAGSNDRRRKDRLASLQVCDFAREALVLVDDVSALHRVVQVVDQLVETLQLALRPSPNAVPPADLLEHRRADAKRHCGPHVGGGVVQLGGRSQAVWMVKKRACDVDDGPVEQGRNLLNA